MASSVRAKAAMFANLGNNGSGNNANNLGGGQSVYNKHTYPIGSSSSSSATILGNSAIVNTSSSSSSAIQLPPTSSASTSDPSISLPINAPFYPKVSAGLSNTPTRKPVSTLTKQEEPPSPYTAARLRANSAKSQASKSTQSQEGPSEQPSLLSTRRKQVNRLDIPDQKPTKNDIGKMNTTNGDITPSASPPLLPIKPYPPKLSAGAPQTPFALNFPSPGKSESPSAVEKDYSNGTFARQQSRIPRLSLNRSLGEKSVGSSSKKVEEGLETNLTKDMSRESVYSTTSSLGVSANVVVTTANAVSIQRMPNPARTIASNSTASQIRPTRAAQGPSVDKGIGVKTRRKSRESTSSERRRPRSNRNSNAPSEKAANVSMTFNSDQGQNDKRIGATSVNNDDSRSIEKPTKRSLTVTPRFPTAMQEGLGANHKSNNEEKSGSTATKNKMDRLAPLDIPRADRIISGHSTQSISSTSSAISDSYLDSMSGKYGFSLSGVSATSLSHETLDPLSETWGRNSNISGESMDIEERLLSKTGLKFPKNETDSIVTKEKDFKLTIDAPSETGGAEEGKVGANKTLEMKRILSKVGDRIASARSGSTPDLSAYDHTNGVSSQRVTQSTSPLTTNSQSGSAFKMATPMTKDALLTELLTSMSLVDTQSFKALDSLEDVEILKRNLTRVERDIGDVQLKLKVHIRVRDAANKVRKASARPRNGSGNHYHSASISSVANTPITPSFSATALKDSFGNHARRVSSSSTIAGVSPSDVQQSEADAAAATKKVDHISRKLLELHAEAGKLRRQLLEHHAIILASRIVSLESALQQHEQLRQQEDDKEEESKVGALLAADELDRLRDKHARVEQALKHEQEDRQKEIERWRKKYEEDTQMLKQQHKTLQDDHSRNMKQLQDQHSIHSTTANETQQSLEERIRSQDKELEERQTKYEELQKQMQQLDFETTAERNIMNQRQLLFSAFEQRLERAEKRLREQDDRCARMLGKAEGREEMDDLLNQIKFGTSGVPKKEKTAGQDIDGLIDSLTTHINDMEDELGRATMNGLRGDTGDSDGEGEQRSAPRGMSSYDSEYAETIDKLNGELHGAQREAEEWRIQAESAKRRLANIQRQSAISMTSTTNGRLSVTGWNAGQSSYGSGFAGRRPSNGTSTLMRLSGPSRSAAELEARITLLERRNAALEAELSHAREEGTSIDTIPESLGKENSSFTKVSGSAESLSYNSMKLRSPRSPKSSNGTTDVFTNTVVTLLELLPALDQGSTDLHEIQEELESMPRNEGIDTNPSNAKEICRIVVDRTRAALFVGRSLVGKLLALEMEKRDMEEELEAVQGEHEEMKVAMEDMRNGHASQMQIIEANKTREQQLQIALSGLEVELEETRKQMRKQLASAQTSLTPTSAIMQTSPSLASMINSQASHIIPLQQRRNIMPVHRSATMLVAPSNGSSNGQSPSSMRGTTALPVHPPLVSPSSSKFSLSSTLQTTSTPATSYPAWSPSVAGNGTAMNLSEITPSKSSSIPKRTRTDTIASGSTPRTMMLGMGTNEMMERIRTLEADLAYAKIHSNRSKAEEVERGEMDSRILALQTELESNRMEMEEVRNVESRQRIDLMEELTNLTTELSDARAQLRQRNNEPVRRR